MRQNIILTRASPAGFVWAVIFGVPYMLRGFLNGETHTDSVVGDLGLLGMSVLLLSALGLVLALPYAAVLTFWEGHVCPNDRRFLIGSVLICGVLVAIPATYFGLYAHGLLPLSGFTGSMRIAVTHVVTALVAGNAVGRYLPQTGDNPVVRVYEHYRGWLWAGYIFGILIALSVILFPTFGGASFPLTLML